MTGNISGVATRFKNVAKPGFVRVWCGAYQLDLVLQKAYIILMDGEYYSQLTKAISYLRKQQILIEKMQSTAPTVAHTRWEYMFQVAKWFTTNKVDVDIYLLKKTTATPTPAWWLFVLVVKEFAEIATITFKSLQQRQVTLEMQRSILSNFCNSLLFKVGGQIAQPGSHVEFWSSSGRYIAEIYVVKRLVFNLGSFAKEKVHLLDEAELEYVFKDIAELYLFTASAVEKIIATSNNEEETHLPPVMPNKLATMEHFMFCDYVQVQSGRLEAAGWTVSEIDKIEQDHQSLCNEYNKDQSLRHALTMRDDNISLLEAWSSVRGNFRRLQAFVGGIATVFSTTTQVESDFSILKAEKDTFLSSLTDLSLEGVLHCKQFELLAAASIS